MKRVIAREGQIQLTDMSGNGEGNNPKMASMTVVPAEGHTKQAEMFEVGELMFVMFFGRQPFSAGSSGDWSHCSSHLGLLPLLISDEPS